MSEFSNPYRPGEPVADPQMLFGRQDAADWIDLQISSGSRAMVLSALPLVGKTSFLSHVDTLQNKPGSSLLVSLSELPSLRAKRAERNQAESEQTLDTVLRTFLDQILPQLTLLRLIHDDYLPSSPRVASALRELFTVVSRNLSSDQLLMLYVDDLQLLVENDLALVSSFLTSLLPLLDECPALRLVFAVNQDKLKQIRHSLLDGAPIYQLGTLPTDASINMVTTPVKGILRFDYGVTKRIAEVNSHHPYYLSLYCYTLLNRQVHDGWVNQQDFDTVLAEILDSPIEPFARIWDESTWAERAVLAGMAAIQGAHGPITGQEVIRYLQRQKQSVDPTVVQNALNTLAERSVLTPMGAVSYRFQVELLRFWLREHTDPTEIIEQVNWSRAASDLKPVRKASRRPARSTPHRTSPAARRPRKARPRWFFPALGGSLFLCILLAATGLFVTQSPGTLFAFFSSATPTPTATPDSDIAPLADASGAGTPDAPAEPTPTPSPTPALVVARSLPSVTYMGRDVDENWRIYVMDADGSNQTALTSGEEGDDASPIWSSDGQKIAFVSRRDGNREIYVMDATGENVANVTRHPADDWTPAWSPDSTQLAFSSFRDGSWEIFVMDTACLSEPASCPNALTQLTSNGQGNLSPAWSPDGTRLAFNNKANDNWDVYTMSARGSDVRQITTSPENDLAPVWSPDGSLIAFESNRDGNVEVYVIGANGGTPRNISNLALADDHGPTWSPDGQQLVFYSNREGNWDIFAAPLEGGLVTNLSRTPARDEQTPAWRP